MAKPVLSMNFICGISGEAMSKIGKAIINIPNGVDINFSGLLVKVKGPKGELSFKIPFGINVEKKDNIIIVKPKDEEFGHKVVALWGTVRAIIANMVKGVVDGFEKKLEIEGIGFKALMQGKDIVLTVGFSHPVNVKCPESIVLKAEKNIITISGCDKDLVGRTAAAIRKIKKPEPYKGTGIRYAGEIIKKKAGKKATSAA